MIFSSIDFFIFFALVLGVLSLLKNLFHQKVFLLLASYFFYGYWDVRFVPLMFGMSYGAYWIGRRIEGTPDALTKKRWLVAGIALDLVVLGIFKYYNFFTSNINEILAASGMRMPYLDILLPIGISFITFEVISYKMDIYRGENESASNFLDLSLLVAFFPHLIAGPILKPKHFLPQLQIPIKIRMRNLHDGSQIFLFGMVKKILVADRLALFVDPVFASPAQYDSITLWAAVIAYAVQIYCDFSGYSDMAIGSARCMGFDIPKNFDMPYISTSITEFWRRWHISLSTWLKEYLYFSLGGNRKGRVRQYFNLFTVMLLGGLWHGASWNFVLWGAMHGIALAVHKIYMETFGAGTSRLRPLYLFVSWAITFVFVCITWVFFRSSDFAQSLFIVKKMFAIASPQGMHWIATSLMIILPLVIVAHWQGNKLQRYYTTDLRTFRGLFLLFFTLMGLLFFMPLNSSPFIYFQF
ncbi:MAG: MBOAT family O-acyltransferase [Verrucomicrobiales bacterium]